MNPHQFLFLESREAQVSDGFRFSVPNYAVISAADKQCACQKQTPQEHEVLLVAVLLTENQ